MYLLQEPVNSWLRHFLFTNPVFHLHYIIFCTVWKSCIYSLFRYHVFSKWLTFSWRRSLITCRILFSSLDSSNSAFKYFISIRRFSCFIYCSRFFSMFTFFQNKWPFYWLMILCFDFSSQTLCTLLMHIFVPYNNCKTLLAPIYRSYQITRHYCPPPCIRYTQLIICPIGYIFLFRLNWKI